MIYLLIIALFILSYFGTKKSIGIISSLEILDSQSSAPLRKTQLKPIPLLGGLVFTVVGIIGMIAVWTTWKFDIFGLSGILNNNLNSGFHIAWIIIALFIIIIGGFLDDKYRLSSLQMLIPINLAILVAVFFGNIRITSLSYPFDTIFPSIDILQYIFAYIWIGLCLAATKFLDGHDGLVGSVGILSLGSIAIVSLFENVNQPMIFALSFVWIASIGGFLPYNLPNARIYLGEIGSEVIGFMIGVLSIISGAKVATVSSIIGWFVLDLLLVFWIRYRAGKGLLEGGREHWHFRLYDAGLTKWQVLGITFGIISVTLVLGLTLPTLYKPLVLILQLVVLLIVYYFTQKKRR
jgi:UDP-GlcNAc:undecaprenyl-phosphate/decaprenyl-phosphate GlcNAc-1-phosphate transferase